MTDMTMRYVEDFRNRGMPGDPFPWSRCCSLFVKEAYRGVQAEDALESFLLLTREEFLAGFLGGTSPPQGTGVCGDYMAWPGHGLWREQPWKGHDFKRAMPGCCGGMEVP